MILRSRRLSEKTGERNGRSRRSGVSDFAAVTRCGRSPTKPRAMTAGLLGGRETCGQSHVSCCDTSVSGRVVGTHRNFDAGITPGQETPVADCDDDARGDCVNRI